MEINLLAEFIMIAATVETQNFESRITVAENLDH